VDFTDGQVALAAPEDITLRLFRTAPDAVPTVAVERAGTTTMFGPEHAREGENYRIDPSAANAQDRKNLWTWAGYPLDHANGFHSEDGPREPLRRKHHIPIGFWYDTPTTDPLRNAVIGLQTAPGDMPTHAVPAFYEGSARLEAWNKDDGSIRSRFRSDLRLEADFADNTLTGMLDDWRVQEIRGDNEGDYERRDGIAYVIPETSITGNGFMGELAPAAGCTACSQIIASTVAGTFYGPYAQETGGTIQGELKGEDGDPDEVMIGIFYTERE